MSNDLPVLSPSQPIGRTVDGKTVLIDPLWYRLWMQSMYDRVGGASAPSNTELNTTITNINNAMLSATYRNGLFETINNNAGTETLLVGELDQYDIDYYLTAAQIADTRNPSGPTIDLTDVIQAAHDAILARYTSDPLPNKKAAGMAGRLRFHGSYLVRQLNIHPAIMIEGDSFRDTIFVQASGATAPLITALARLGKTTGSRCMYPIFQNFSIQMSPAVFGPDAGAGPVALHGIYAEPGHNDPNDFGGGYNGPLCNFVNVTGASGSAFYITQSRHAPKLRFCYASGCGVNLDGAGNYGDGIYIGSNADAEVNHCGSGGHGGHSLNISSCETPQVVGGDYWASKNAATGYRAIQITNSVHWLVDGPDINGVVEYDGGAPVVWTKGRWVNCNFRFRESSFGDAGDGSSGFVPSPQDAYIITKNAHGVSSTNCYFSPSFDSTGAVNARTSYIYECLGDALHIADDNLPALSDVAWPAGANLAIAPDYTTICNSPSKLVFRARAMMDTGPHRTLMNYWSGIPGVDSGQWGRIDGAPPTTGTVGESLDAKVAAGAAIALTTATNADVVTLALTPGEWEVSGTIQYSGIGATGTVLRSCVGSTATTITQTDSRVYDGYAVPWTTITDDIHCAKLGPARVSVSAATTLYLTARAVFSAGTMSAYGAIHARRVN